MLYIISTPIGNLKDITLRALETLETIDYLLCEDTRVTGNLLKLLGIKNRPQLISFYDEIELQKIPQVIKLLEDGGEVGLVTDAGTPLISDPGWLLLQKCQKLGIKYTCLPGACAAINAAVLSGLPIQRFSFLGFLPRNSGDRKKILESYKNVSTVKIVYEAPGRLIKTIEDIKTVYGSDTQIKIIREMTKKFEEILTPDQINNLKGEAVIVF